MLKWYKEYGQMTIEQLAKEKNKKYLLKDTTDSK